MAVLLTSGVNYPPPEPMLATDLTAEPRAGSHDPSISTLHLEIRVRADYRGKTIDLIGPLTGCGSGCRKRAGADAVDTVEILRFAKSGTTAYPLPVLGTSIHRLNRRLLPGRPGLTGVQWLITMEDGVGLQGTLTRGSGAEQAAFGGILQLAGRMRITMQFAPGTAVRTLLSREQPNLVGAVRAWPPRDAVIELDNGPIEYFDASTIDLPDAKPILTVTSNQVSFGTAEVALLSRPPEILSAEVLTGGPSGTTGPSVRGVRLSWNDTRGEVPASEPPVRFYHVYRRFEDDDVSGWVLIRSLPASVTSWVDDGFSGELPAYYLVLHAASYPFDYRYESLLPTPVRVAATAEP